jgi:anti-sigma B factor antagonist
MTRARNGYPIDVAVDTGARIASGLRIGEREIDGVWALSAAGELDLAAAPRFCASVDGARAAGHRIVLLDLTELEFCDSCGLRALRGVVHEIVACAGRVAVVPPADGAVARLFEIVGAGEFLPLHPSADAAMAALKPLGRRLATAG